jgi:hypothetical protein
VQKTNYGRYPPFQRSWVTLVAENREDISADWLVLLKLHLEPLGILLEMCQIISVSMLEDRGYIH